MIETTNQRGPHFDIYIMFIHLSRLPEGASNGLPDSVQPSVHANFFTNLQ